ncbi:hypothetical protein [Emticicia soli]|uniref:Uncharacterized protein n=1 Tax=Emticicia soli TaxID=2027878 RepID=A0ABW5J987_9BACT
MSGGGPSAHFSSSGTTDECSNLHLTTKLATPNPDLIANLEIGMILDVTLSNGSIVVVTELGEIVGSVIGRDSVKLKNCMENGYSFSAEILNLNGGSCDVLIKSI